MNSSTFQDIVRYGVTVLMAIYLLELAINGTLAADVDYSIVRDYNNLPKLRSKPREIRGFKPHSMSTAIGFGKRQINSYPSSEPNEQDETVMHQLTDFSKRFPMEWFIRVFKINPETSSKAETSLSNEENMRRLVMQRYKKTKNDDPLDYE